MPACLGRLRLTSERGESSLTPNNCSNAHDAAAKPGGRPPPDSPRPARCTAAAQPGGPRAAAGPAFPAGRHGIAHGCDRRNAGPRPGAARSGGEPCRRRPRADRPRSRAARAIDVPPQRSTRPPAGRVRRATAAGPAAAGRVGRRAIGAARGWCRGPRGRECPRRGGSLGVWQLGNQGVEHVAPAERVDLLVGEAGGGAVVLSGGPVQVVMCGE